MKKKSLQEELHGVWDDWVHSNDYGLWHDSEHTTTTGTIVEAVAGKAAADTIAPVERAPSPIDTSFAPTPAKNIAHASDEDELDGAHTAAVQRSAKKAKPTPPSPASSIKTVKPKHGLNLGPHAPVKLAAPVSKYPLSAGVGPRPKGRRVVPAAVPAAAAPSIPSEASPAPAPAPEAKTPQAINRDASGRLRIKGRIATKAEAEALGVPWKV